MTLKPVKTAAQCAAELAAIEARLKARILAERQQMVAKHKLEEDEQWRRDFNRKARELYLSKTAQERLDSAATSSGVRSTYSVLSELARAGVA